MNLTRFAVLTLVLALAGCSHRMPTATIEVIDTSLSITPRAEHAALNAAARQIAHLGRGDSLILIPITGDAEHDSGGRILRLQAPTRREPYDADLRRFRDEAEKQFAAWASSVRAEPGRSDIFGALDAAMQELATLPKGTTRRVVVVSDFLEDDARYRFTTDSALAKPGTARQLASRVRTERGFNVQDAHVCFGRLESTDFAALSSERKEAITAFWRTYAVRDGHSPQIEIDGLELMDGAGSSCLAEPIIGSGTSGGSR